MAKSAPDISLTFIRLDKSLKKPLYVQLYEAVKQAVLNGMLKPGDRMPASRNLSKDFGIARNAVVKAYEQLMLEGYLGGKTGAGTFVSVLMDQPELLPQRQKAGKNETLQNAGLFSPLSSTRFQSPYMGHDSSCEQKVPFQNSIPAIHEFPFKTWARIAADLYRNIHTLHLGYDHGQGYLPLREVIASQLRISRSINCEANQIVIVNGSRQGIHLISEMFVRANDQCWIEDPGYTGAYAAFSRAGAEICPVPVTSQGIDLDYAVANYPHAKLVYVTPSHQFPLGITMPLQERLRLLKYAEEHQMIIIEDDYDSDFRYNGRPIPALKGLDTKGHVYYVGTFSKSLFPALRIGYIVLPSPGIAERFALAKAITDRQSPVIDQAILTEFIRAGHFQRHLRKMSTLYKKAQDELCDLLTLHLSEQVEVYPADAGMHFVIKLKDLSKIDFLLQNCASAGLVLMPIDNLSMKFKMSGCFLVGFTGFSKEELKSGVMILKRLLD